MDELRVLWRESMTMQDVQLNTQQWLPQE